MPRGLSNRSSSAYLRRWRLWTCTRHASSGGTGPRGHIPFPTHPRPTPHQIFHLPHGATAAEIKSRYYELMKLYHPDSAQFRTNPFEILTPELRQERLNAIRGAYDALRGAKQARWGASHRGPSMGERAGAEGRRWTGKKNEWGGFAYEPEVRPHPDGLTEPFILSKNGVMMSLVAVVVLTVLSFRILYISPATIAARKHDEARSNLEEARRLGREHGEERRRELRKWIDEGGMKGFGTKIGHGGPRPPAEDHDKMTAKSHNGSSEAERSSASSQP